MKNIILFLALILSFHKSLALDNWPELAPVTEDTSASGSRRQDQVNDLARAFNQRFDSQSVLIDDEKLHIRFTGVQDKIISDLTLQGALKPLFLFDNNKNKMAACHISAVVDDKNNLLGIAIIPLGQPESDVVLYNSNLKLFSLTALKAGRVLLSLGGKNVLTLPPAQLSPKSGGRLIIRMVSDFRKLLMRDLDVQIVKEKDQWLVKETSTGVPFYKVMATIEVKYLSLTGGVVKLDFQ